MSAIFALGVHPTERFDFVLIRLIYAPVNRRGEMVQHILRYVLKPKGRLIITPGGTEEIGSHQVERLRVSPAKDFLCMGVSRSRNAEDDRVDAAALLD